MNFKERFYLSMKLSAREDLSFSERYEILKKAIGESVWDKKLDRVSLDFTPLWFRFVEWLFILGVLVYLSMATLSVWIIVLTGISSLVLFLYIQASIFRNKFFEEIVSKQKLWKRFLSYCLAFLIMGVITVLIILMVNELRINYPKIPI